MGLTKLKVKAKVKQGRGGSIDAVCVMEALKEHWTDL